MLPDLLSTLIGLCLVCIAVLDADLLYAHGTALGVAGAVLIALGIWAKRADYLKWPGVTVIVAGVVLLAAAASGLAAQSHPVTFWLAFWSGNAAGVVSLWSTLYRGPRESTLTAAGPAPPS
jgi:hypothetical protein